MKALSNLSVEGAWLGIAAYTLHIFLDFSAYSDMAIGMGRMIGLHYLENFNYPYISRSVTEFWRRWHMSLGTFFRDYVYIPLGGNRCSFGRMLFNTLIVWALTGLWHGASWNFVLWGLWSFLFLMVEKFALKKWLDRIPVLSNLYLIVFAMLGWVIFRFTDIHLMLALVKSLFGLNGNSLTSFTSHLQLQSHLFLLIISSVACTPLVKLLGQKIGSAVRKNAVLEIIWDIVVYGLIPVVLLLISTACLVGDSYNPFIYFQF
jgi:alginate O-acetyltransferase complex protein AlgI